MDESAARSSSTLKKKITVLQRLVTQKAIRSKQSSKATVEVENESETISEKEEEASISSGQRALFDFMRAAGNPITFVESREIWNDMCSTNNGSFPLFQDAFLDISHHSYSRACSVESTDTSSSSSSSSSSTKSNNEELDASEDGDKVGTHCDEEDGQMSQKATAITQQDIASLSDAQLVHFAEALAEGIKDTYSIRKRDDNTELKFIFCSLGFLWMTAGSIAIAGYYHPDNTKLGTFNGVTLKSILMESFILFAAEFVWECFLSWIVLRYNIKINYTRKLGNLLKVPKYFVADLFPSFTSTALSMTTALAINQTLFCLMYYRKSRERVPFFAYVFLSQDRREDRPDTLIFQVTEDIMRFGIYFPFKLLVLDLVQKPAIIFIPIAVNNIGDGLAEPVGVAFGKHKYSTTALYHKGRFFHSKFTRSYEGSACVFFTTAIVVAANYHEFFTPTRFWVTFCILPFLMTIAEAKAPHTNDGPFLALIGCSFLSAVFLVGRE